MRSALYTGTLIHARRTPAEHVFRYPVCFYAIDLDEIPELDRRLKLFSYNKPGVVTLRDSDHLGDPTRPVAENIRAHLEGRGIPAADARITRRAGSTSSSRFSDTHHSARERRSWRRLSE